MVGLVDYGSSDDEDLPQQEEAASGAPSAATAPAIVESSNSAKSSTKPQNGTAEDVSMSDAPTQDSLSIGPVQGPSRPAGPDFATQQEGADTEPSISSDSQAQIRNLTLPPFPNFDIPPSPPGSPPAGSSEKITQFLELKKKGVHFNDRLENSSALRNPALLEKLRKFAGIGEEDQYASALPDDLRDATSFPKWAYKDELAKTQREFNKKRMDDRAKVSKDAIEFAPGRVE